MMTMIDWVLRAVRCAGCLLSTIMMNVAIYYDYYFLLAHHQTSQLATIVEKSHYNIAY
jgi:hypothetical protein